MWSPQCDIRLHTEEQVIRLHPVQCRMSKHWGEEFHSGMHWTTLHTIEYVLHSHSSHSIHIPNIENIVCHLLCRIWGLNRHRILVLNVDKRTFHSYLHYAIASVGLVDSNLLYTTPSVGNIPLLRLNYERPPAVWACNNRTQFVNWEYSTSRNSTNCHWCTAIPRPRPFWYSARMKFSQAKMF